MKKTTNKFWAILLTGCLLLTGCARTPAEPDHTLPANTGAPEPTEYVAPAENPQPTEAPREMSDEAYASLVSLRQALIGTPQLCAVAYFGYALPDGNTAADPYAVMAGVAPQLCENLPFLLQIPHENVLGTEGHLFCILPADENATVAVNWSPFDENTGTFGEATVLYRSEKGDPFLLMTENTGWCMETEVIITDSQGTVTVWYPFIDENGRIASLRDINGASVYYDFTPYDRLGSGDLLGGTPSEMAGFWELAWTEVEGDRVESERGSWTVEITAEGEDSFRISYTDKYFPEDSFTGRELLVFPGELYPGCGNNQWIAEVSAENDDLFRYAVTLLDDGTLLMRYSWEMDGMTMAGHGWFLRAS